MEDIGLSQEGNYMRNVVILQEYHYSGGGVRIGELSERKLQFGQ